MFFTRCVRLSAEIRGLKWMAFNKYWWDNGKWAREKPIKLVYGYNTTSAVSNRTSTFFQEVSEAAVGANIFMAAELFPNTNIYQ